MQRIVMHIDGVTLDFTLAQKVAQTLLEQRKEEKDLIAWFDGIKNRQSPALVCSEVKGQPGWERYGLTHGADLRISFNDDQLVFLYGNMG